MASRRPRVGLGIAPVFASMFFGMVGAEVYAIRNASSTVTVACAWVLLLTTLFPFLRMAAAGLIVPKPKSAVDLPRRREKVESDNSGHIYSFLFSPAAFAHELWLAHHEFNRSYKAPRPNAKVLLLGDSLTAYWSVLRVRDERCMLLEGIWIPQAIFLWVWLLSAPLLAQDARVRLLAKLISLLDMPHPLLEEIDGVNLGIMGDRTRQLLWRIHNGELDLAPPSIQVVWCTIGLNEFKMRECGADETADNIVAVAKELETRMPANVKVVVQALLPWQGEVDTDPQVLKECNDATKRKLPKECGSRVSFVDVSSAMQDAKGEFDTACFGDVAHPNETGYQAWGKAMLPLVKGMLQS